MCRHHQRLCRTCDTAIWLPAPSEHHPLLATWPLSPTTPTRTTTSCWQRCSQHWRQGQTPRWRRCPPAQAARHVGTRAAARRAWPATQQPTPASSAWRSMGACRRGPGAGRQQRGLGVMVRGVAAAASTPQLGSVSSTGWWGARHARLGSWTHAGGRVMGQGDAGNLLSCCLRL